MKIITITPEELQELIRESVREALSERTLHQPASKKPMTVEQAAQYLHMPKSSLYSFTRKREIPFTKPGKSLLFIQSELDEWLQVHRRVTRQEIESQPNIRPGKGIARWKR